MNPEVQCIINKIKETNPERGAQLEKFVQYDEYQDFITNALINNDIDVILDFLTKSS